MADVISNAAVAKIDNATTEDTINSNEPTNALSDKPVDVPGDATTASVEKATQDLEGGTVALEDDFVEIIMTPEQQAADTTPVVEIADKISDVEGPDLVAYVDSVNTSAHSEAIVGQALDATDALSVYGEAAADEGASDQTLKVLEVAVENLRTTLGMPKPSLGLENYTYKRVALEAEIKDTLRKVWEAIKEAFEKLVAWIKSAIAKLRGRKESVLSRLKKSSEALKLLAQNKEVAGSVKLDGIRVIGKPVGVTSDSIIRNINADTKTLDAFNKQVLTKFGSNFESYVEAVRKKPHATLFGGDGYAFTIKQGEVGSFENELDFKKVISANLSFSKSQLATLAREVDNFIAVYEGLDDTLEKNYEWAIDSIGKTLKAIGTLDGEEISKLKYYLKFHNSVSRFSISAVNVIATEVLHNATVITKAASKAK